MRLVPEPDSCSFQLPVSLDIDLFMGVNEDVVDRMIFQERLQGAESGDLMQDILHHLSTLPLIERDFVLLQDLLDQLSKLLP